MKAGKAVLLLAALSLAAASSAAWSHGRGHGGVRFGFVVGLPLVWHYPPPVYYYPRPVIVAPAPPAYIEREPVPDEAAPPATGYWYYCRGADAYYPYVRHCPGGWERVSPQPPG